MMSSNVAVPEEVIVHDDTSRREIVSDTVKVSWSAIIAGLVVALGAWILLSVLGLALGLSQADPNNPASLKSVGMITGIWSVIVPIVALLIGGLVASRTAGVVTRPTGAIHGIVLWALVTVAGLVLVGSMVRGVMGAGAGLASMVGADVPALAGAAPDIAQSLGIRADDVLAPVNERLKAEGKPAVTPRELDASLKDVAGTSVREGRVDRDVIVTAVTRNTRLTERDAEDLADRIETQVNQRATQLGQNIETGAARIADTTGHAMWWVFLGMVLGLGAAIVGSTLGVSRRQRLAALAPRDVYIAHHPAVST